MFEFEGTWFNASMITAMDMEGDEVRVYIHGRESHFYFECQDAAEAERKLRDLAARWKAAIS